jgi:hypothetical protein
MTTQVLNIKWDEQDYRPVLNALNTRLEQPMRSNLHLATRALLEMLQANIHPITGHDVAEFVYDNDAPKGGWIDWDWTKWDEYGPKAVEALKSDNPLKALYLA